MQSPKCSGSLYLSGIGPLGAKVALLTPPVASHVVASSGAALAVLARGIGGSMAVSSLFSKRYFRLLEGSGSSDTREALGRLWLEELRLPLDLELSDLLLLGHAPCSFLLYCSQDQAPMVFDNSESSRSVGPIYVRELAAALCSQVPVRIRNWSLLDAERIIPPEYLAGFLHPPPLFCMGPLDTALKASRTSQNNPLHTEVFVDRLLRNRHIRCPYFRPTKALLQRVCNGRKEVIAAAILCYLWACALEVLPDLARYDRDLTISVVRYSRDGR